MQTGRSEQVREPLPCEVIVMREDFGDALLCHVLHRDAIGEAVRDTTGKKIEVWPGSYRLNLTRPEVAEYQAHYACQRMLANQLMYDGCFFDNFMTTQSWQTHATSPCRRPSGAVVAGHGKPDEQESLRQARGAKASLP